MKAKLYRPFLAVFLLAGAACQPLTSAPSTATADISGSSPASTRSATETPTQRTPPTDTPEPTNISSPTLTLPPALTGTATKMPTLTPEIIPSTLPIRVMRVDYPDFTNSRSQVALWEQQMKAAGINLVALGAGRLEWTYFKWAGHEANWSSPVRDTGLDYLAEDSARFGQWAQINAVVDVLSPNYIRAHPGSAAIRVDGVPSADLVSTTELTTGEYGRQLLAMIEYIAANYAVNSISLTELFYHIDGYGPDDKASYLAYSGEEDWPRNTDGTIAINDQSIGDWRTHVMDIYLDQIVAVCHKYGKQFFLDVGLTLDYGFSVDSLNHMTNEHGTNYRVVLEHTDKIVIWGYFAIDQFQPEFLSEVAQFLTQFGTERVILSIGLWGRAGPVVSADELRRAILAAQAGGLPHIWITPGSLMTAGHWQVLDQLWGTP